MPKLQIFILPLLVLIVAITSLQNTKKLELNLQTKDIDSCRNFNHNLTDFDKEKMYGNWYPLNQTENIAIFDYCDLIAISPAQDTNTVLTVDVKKRVMGATMPSLTLKLGKTKNPNSFSYYLLGINNVFTIVSTDYDKYAILYVCHDFFLKRGYNAIILSRNHTAMDTELMNNLTAEVRDKLKETKLKMIDQTQC